MAFLVAVIPLAFQLPRRPSSKSSVKPFSGISQIFVTCGSSTVASTQSGKPGKICAEFITMGFRKTNEQTFTSTFFELP